MKEWAGFDRKLYDFPDVDHILGLTHGTAQRWVNGYERRGVHYPPVVRERAISPESLVTWGEFVEVFYLARFRDDGIPLRRLRRILMSVRERTGVHYLFGHDKTGLKSNARIREIILEVQQKEGFPTFLVKRTGQGMLHLWDEAEERLSKIEFRQGVAVGLQPRLELPNIFVRGEEFFGKPKIKGTGISPIALAAPVISGTPKKHVAESYGVRVSVVNEAGKFEFGRRWAFAAA